MNINRKIAVVFLKQCLEFIVKTWSNLTKDCNTVGVANCELRILIDRNCARFRRSFDEGCSDKIIVPVTMLIRELESSRITHHTK